MTLTPSSLTRSASESVNMIWASLNTVATGAHATERLIADRALAGVTGRYFNGTAEGRADAQAYDAHAREQLWELSDSLTS